jgi:hypothetical protein
MADAIAGKAANILAGPVIDKLKEELGRAAKCRSEAKKLEQELTKWVGDGDIASRILDLPPSMQSKFETQLWTFLDAVEDAQDVIQSALQLKWYDLWGLWQHSRQLASIRERLEGTLDLHFENRLLKLEDAAKKAKETMGAATTAAAVSGGPAVSSGQQGSADVSHIFQHTENLIPQLKAELSAPGGEMNLALCGMPGSGKTSIVRRLFEDLQPAFEAAFFMTVSKTPDPFDLLKQAATKLLEKTRSFPFDTPADLRDHLMEELRGKTVLLVLDDVWEPEHLKVLNFATGILRDSQRALVRHESSRLLVTTRNERVLQNLKGHEEVSVKKVPLLTPPHDQQLLCSHAFSDSQPELQDDWKPVVKEVVTACKGNPLLLRVTGAGLRNKPLDEWKQRVKKLKETGERVGDMSEVMKLCRPSYDDLGLVARECFKLFAAFPEDRTIEVPSLVSKGPATLFCPSERVAPSGSGLDTDLPQIWG